MVRKIWVPEYLFCLYNYLEYPQFGSYFFYNLICIDIVIGFDFGNALGGFAHATDNDAGVGINIGGDDGFNLGGNAHVDENGGGGVDFNFGGHSFGIDADSNGGISLGTNSKQTDSKAKNSLDDAFNDLDNVMGKTKGFVLK